MTPKLSWISRRCRARTATGTVCKNKRQENGFCHIHQDNAELESSQAAPTTATESPSRIQRVVLSLTRRAPGKANQKSTENAGPSGILPGAPDQTSQSPIKGAASRNSTENTGSSGILPGAPDQTSQSSIKGAASRNSTENPGPSGILPGAPDQTSQGSIKGAASPHSTESPDPWDTWPSDPDKTSLSSIEQIDTLGKLPCTPTKQNENPMGNEGIQPTPVSESRGSEARAIAKVRQGFMASNLQDYSYQSPTVLDLFLEGVPDIDEQVIGHLHEQRRWKDFKSSCTGGKGKGKDQVSPTGNDSNEDEFRDLVECIAGLKGVEQYFKRQKIGEESGSKSDEPQLGSRRISHQGSQSMQTWNPRATWLKGSVTERKKELKPDFMTLRVKTVEKARSRRAQTRWVIPIWPETILPPPEEWETQQMEDNSFPIVKSRDPVWECLELFWECKRNQGTINAPGVILDCALKAAEVLRYQWSRRFVYCFLHCGTKMQLLQFNRSGLMASGEVDVVGDTATFVRCLIGAFCHRTSRLGFPEGPSAPYHETVEGKLRQIVTVQDRKLYLLDQVAGPPRDHLVSRATVTFKAKLLQPTPTESDQEYCFKSSWAQKGRRHEGEYLRHLQGTPGTVSMLVYDVARVKLDDNNIVDDTTCLGQFRPKTTKILSFQEYLNTPHRLGLNLPPSTSILPSSRDDIDQNPPRDDIDGVVYDEREHRQIVCTWVEDSFNDAVAALIKQQDISSLSSLWQNAFQAIDAIVRKGVIHRDISFRNMRVDRQKRVQVCDFDMATILGNPSSGAKERTGTVMFMACAILYGNADSHRPFHDCESVFWICALSLLNTTAVEKLRRRVNDIHSPDTSLEYVAMSKEKIIGELKMLTRESEDLEESVSVNTEAEKSLFHCLTDLSRILAQNDFDHNYKRADGEFEKNCFQQFAKGIAQTLGEAEIIKGTAEISLESGTSSLTP